MQRVNVLQNENERHNHGMASIEVVEALKQEIETLQTNQTKEIEALQDTHRQELEKLSKVHREELDAVKANGSTIAESSAVTAVMETQPTYEFKEFLTSQHLVCSSNIRK